MEQYEAEGRWEDPAPHWLSPPVCPAPLAVPTAGTSPRCMGVTALCTPCSDPIISPSAQMVMEQLRGGTKILLHAIFPLQTFFPAAFLHLLQASGLKIRSGNKFCRTQTRQRSSEVFTTTSPPPKKKCLLMPAWNDGGKYRVDCYPISSSGLSLVVKKPKVVAAHNLRSWNRLLSVHGQLTVLKS